MGLLKHALGKERTLNLLITNIMVVINDDVAYLHLDLLVDINIKDDHVLVGHIITLGDSNDCILIAFLIKILLGQDLCTINDIRMNTHSLHHTKFLFQILTF